MKAPHAFTIVELLVVVVLIVILSSLALSGMAVARQRAKVDRTRTTIRKLSEIIVPMYDDYLRRRVPYAAGGNATTNAISRLKAIRELMVVEMPDSWADILKTRAQVTGIEAYKRTAPVYAYAAQAEALPAAVAATNGSAECLFMVLSRGCFEPDVMEQFRDDEMGDTDNDRVREFVDGWGQPLIFMRWAPGYRSILQTQNAKDDHDPFDFAGVDADGYALVPLIVSAGPDRLLGMVETHSPAAGWQQYVVTPTLRSIVGLPQKPALGSVTDDGVARDNVSNHELLVR